mmetsp:Transcript_34308/g.78560  ORF Transcript_34308/g.78560 Transcript_34308/m.78560 type:complete len:255 (+) Transcript_34308:1689-2453(+)
MRWMRSLAMNLSLFRCCSTDLALPPADTWASRCLSSSASALLACSLAWKRASSVRTVDFSTEEDEVGAGHEAVSSHGSNGSPSEKNPRAPRRPPREAAPASSSSESSSTAATDSMTRMGSPPESCWPAAALTSRIVPPFSTRTSVSSFMAERTAMVSPAWTTSPALTFTSTTLPSKGASTVTLTGWALAAAFFFFRLAGVLVSSAKFFSTKEVKTSPRTKSGWAKMFLIMPPLVLTPTISKSSSTVKDLARADS